jgi:alkylated DNA repair dioxygenase AlkB
MPSIERRRSFCGPHLSLPHIFPRTRVALCLLAHLEESRRLAASTGANVVSGQPGGTDTCCWRYLGMENLFDLAPPIAPGFRYEADLVSEAAQKVLIGEIQSLPLQAFDFHGFKANRRVISYGWRYDFSSARLVQIDPIPEWLFPLRAVVAHFAGGEAQDFAHVLISEYAPGAGIGWHRDKAAFDRIVGVSLGSHCPLRLRRATGDGKWRRAQQELLPGSMYLLSGEVRTEWEHSIAPVALLRYSLTFRTLRR